MAALGIYMYVFLKCCFIRSTVNLEMLTIIATPPQKKGCSANKCNEKYQI